MVYYVYVYLNPLKSGNFNYGDISFDYEPFYVGKGHGDRLNHHLKKVKNKNKINQCEKFRLIESILSTGESPIIIKIFDNLGEMDSLRLEKEIIQRIGRVNLESGPLTNLNDGGQTPQLNYKHSEESKRRISEGGKKSPTRFIELISPNGIRYDKIKLSSFCKENNLNYDVMRKNANRGKIKIRYKQKSNTETINCEGWEVLNYKINRKEPYLKIKYLLVSPDGREYKISSRDTLEDISKSLFLNLRILRLYRNRGRIDLRNINQCKLESSRNCQGWEFIDYKRDKNYKEFESSRIESWEATSPVGEVFYTSNLALFCRNHSLSYRTFQTFKNKTIKMPIRSNFSDKIINSIGWSIKKLN